MRSFGSIIPVTHVEQQEGNRTVKVRNKKHPAVTGVKHRSIHYHNSNPIIVLSNYIAGTQPGIDLWIYINTSKGEIT